MGVLAQMRILEGRNLRRRRDVHPAVAPRDGVPVVPLPPVRSIFRVNQPKRIAGMAVQNDKLYPERRGQGNMTQSRISFAD